MKLNYKIADSIGIQFDLEMDKWLLVKVTLDHELEPGIKVTELTPTGVDELLKDTNIPDEFQDSLYEVGVLLTHVPSSQGLLNRCEGIISDIIEVLNIKYLPILSDRDVLEYAVKDLSDSYYLAINPFNQDTLAAWLRSKVGSLVKEIDESPNYTTESIRIQSEFGPTNNYYYNQVVDRFRELTNKHGISKIDEILDILGIIPNNGRSRYVIGEVFRACNRIMYRFVNDGDLGHRYNAGNFIDNCNLIDFLELDFRSEFKEDIDRVYYNSITESVDVNRAGVTPFEDLLIYQLDSLYSEHSLYERDPALNAIFIELAFYKVMVEKGIEASDEIITALRNLDVEYIKSNVRLGENLQFKSDLFNTNTLDFRSKLLYF